MFSLLILENGTRRFDARVNMIVVCTVCVLICGAIFIWNYSLTKFNVQLELFVIYFKYTIFILQLKYNNRYIEIQIC